MGTLTLDPPDSVPGGTTYRALARLEARDEVLGCTYGFLAYLETDSGGAWRVRIKSTQTAGAVFEPDLIGNQARSAAAQGRDWFPWGYSFDPTPGDPRCIQFRVHVAGGRPVAIEMHARLRRADGSPGPEESVRFPWPG